MKTASVSWWTTSTPRRRKNVSVRKRLQMHPPRLCGRWNTSRIPRRYPKRFQASPWNRRPLRRLLRRSRQHQRCQR